MTAQAGSASHPSFEIHLDALRRRLRLMRAGLSPAYRRAAARNVACRAVASGLLRSHQHIAVYLALTNELDLSHLVDRARRMQCRVYVPRLRNPRLHTMDFVALPPGRPLRRNVLGFLEPAGPVSPVPLRRLDLAFIPLLGFDLMGRRLGMGGGYYDRRFAVLRNRHTWRRPRLIGVGYSVQRVESLPHRPWDVPMDAVLTERTLHISGSR